MVDQLPRGDASPNDSTVAILCDGHLVHALHVDTYPMLHLAQRLCEAMLARDGEEGHSMVVGILDLLCTSALDSC